MFLTAQLKSLKRNAGANGFVVVLFYSLYALVPVRKLTFEYEVKASSPDAEDRDRDMLVYFSALSILLPAIAGACSRFILLLTGFRRYSLGQVPFWGYMIYLSFCSAHTSLLVYFSHRCVLSDGSLLCPMSLSWDYLEAYSQLSEEYVSVLTFISFYYAFTTGLFILACVGGECVRQQCALPALTDTAEEKYLESADGDASYEAVKHSEKGGISEV